MCAPASFSRFASCTARLLESSLTTVACSSVEQPCEPLRLGYQHCNVPQQSMPVQHSKQTDYQEIPSSHTAWELLHNAILWSWQWLLPTHPVWQVQISKCSRALHATPGNCQGCYDSNSCSPSRLGGLRQFSAAHSMQSSTLVRVVMAEHS